MWSGVQDSCVQVWSGYVFEVMMEDEREMQPSTHHSEFTKN